jgi:uncharacterized protein (TIGR00251 family)
MFYKETPEGIILSVRARPGARKDEIAGEWADSIKVRITAPPEKGKANEAIIELLAEKLGLKKSAFRIVSGETSRDKKILIQGVSLTALEPQLKALRSRE